MVRQMRSKKVIYFLNNNNKFMNFYLVFKINHLKFKKDKIVLETNEQTIITLIASKINSLN